MLQTLAVVPCGLMLAPFNPALYAQQPQAPPPPASGQVTYIPGGFRQAANVRRQMSPPDMRQIVSGDRGATNALVLRNAAEQ